MLSGSYTRINVMQPLPSIILSSAAGINEVKRTGRYWKGNHLKDQHI